MRLKLALGGCPLCGGPAISVIPGGGPPGFARAPGLVLWPQGAGRPIPHEVVTTSPQIAEDFREAVAVLPLSMKASAALSRRCLQAVLVDRGGVNPKDSLSRQIDQVLNTLPNELSLNVDAIRNVGNFAAHPMKSENSGAVVDVEEGEAAWLLEVLEALFDFYYVQPARATKAREALNEKLQELGKPPIKGTTRDGEQQEPGPLGREG